MHPFLTIADRAARAAGRHIMQALGRIDRLKVYEKKTHSLVTEVDYEVEQLLITKIRESYPTHNILSEESGYLKGESDYVWIIDPLDGTTNFIHGLPTFAISIAVQYKGQIEQALIYDPLGQETFYATRGQGARRSHQRLRVSQRAHLKNSVLYLNAPPKDKPGLEQWLGFVTPLVAENASIRLLGSAALGLAYVAAGRLEGFISTTALKPWDIAAGALLVEEAGGVMRDDQGGTNYLETGKVIASNAKLSKILVNFKS